MVRTGTLSLSSSDLATSIICFPLFISRSLKYVKLIPNTFASNGHRKSKGKERERGREEFQSRNNGKSSA